MPQFPPGIYYDGITIPVLAGADVGYRALGGKVGQDKRVISVPGIRSLVILIYLAEIACLQVGTVLIQGLNRS